MTDKKYLGLKNAQELSGKRVILKRPIKNGLGEMPEGTVGIVNNVRGYVKDGKIEFLADKCSCCGFQWFVGGLRYTDLELLIED